MDKETWAIKRLRELSKELKTLNALLGSKDEAVSNYIIASSRNLDAAVKRCEIRCMI